MVSQKDVEGTGSGMRKTTRILSQNSREGFGRKRSCNFSGFTEENNEKPGTGQQVP
jgi:hypothetical protein